MPCPPKFRFQRALEEDIKRLEREQSLYEASLKADKASRKSFRDSIGRIASLGTRPHDSFHTKRLVKDGKYSIDNDVTDENQIATLAEAFRTEIEALDEECRKYEMELLVLRSLTNDQQNLARDLDNEQDSVLGAENDLEIEAMAFDNDQELLSRSLATVHEELDRVSSATIQLPSRLYDLQVDKRGLRYPLINDLRLAYRPKGDVRWDEIQGAWSLAAQLLLLIGTTFKFQSKHCKIVPLSQCAKLIYYPPETAATVGAKATNPKKRDFVYNLGHPETNAKRALLTWNALMCQIIHYVQNEIVEARNDGLSDGGLAIPALPFEVTPTKIGHITLTQLDESDDAGWSKAIHYTASNMLWLSDCASLYIFETIWQ